MTTDHTARGSGASVAHTAPDHGGGDHGSVDHAGSGGHGGGGHGGGTKAVIAALLANIGIATATSIESRVRTAVPAARVIHPEPDLRRPQ